MDDTPVQGRPISTDGVPQTHSLHVPGDVDWAIFNGTAGTRYTIATANLGADVDTVLALFDRDGTTLLALNDDYDGRASWLVWTASAAGAYHVRVSSYGSGTAAGAAALYDLSVTAETAPTATPTTMTSPGQPTPTPTTAVLVATVNPSQGADLTSNNGSVAIDIPAGALGVAEMVTMLYVPEPLPSATPGATLFLAFSLQAVTASGQQITTLAQPISITIKYSDADVAGLDESKLEVYYKDSTGEYVAVSSIVRYPAENTIVIIVDHLTYFVLQGKAQYGLYVPIFLKASSGGW